jgi:hypothetical protein
MNRAAVAATGGALALALWWPAAAAGAAAGAAQRIEDFLPPRLAGADVVVSSETDRTVGAYQLPGKAEGDIRNVAVTLLARPDPIDVREATLVRKPGETIAFAGDSYEGVRLGGRFAQRACGPENTECRVDVMLAKRLVLSLRVERPTDRGEPLRLLEQLDIKGLEAFARKQQPPRVAPASDAGAGRLRKEEAKLVELLRAEPREGIKTVGKPPAGAAAPGSLAALPPPADALTGEQIRRGLGVRSLGVRACYEVAVAENPALSGGEITVSFTVEPGGKLASPKIEASTVADQAVAACVLRQLQKCWFAAARESTSARHTFVFSAGAPLRPDRRAPAPLPSQ